MKDAVAVGDAVVVVEEEDVVVTYIFYRPFPLHGTSMSN